MYTHTYHHRVRYRECDPMGVVYHTHYLDYFEAARTEALRELGIAYRELEESGIIMPVIEANVKYRRPAHYDDELRIITTFTELPQVRVPIAYEVKPLAENTLLASGTVTLCFVDGETRRPIAPPEDIKAAFADAFSEASAGLDHRS